MTGEAIGLILPLRNMKSRTHWKWSLGLVLAALPFAGGYSQETPAQPINNAPALNQQVTQAADAAAPTPADPALANPAAEDDVVDAPAQPLTTAKPLPPGVRPSAAVAEVLKLADSGVDEGVMLAFVTNSTSIFNLGAEEIIYLNDLGVPSAVVTAMIQRDQAIKALSANAAPLPPAPEPPAPAPAAPEPTPAPAPAEMAPQPDETAGNYPPAADTAYAPFYDSLTPYGTWVDVAGYGPCWQPSVVIVNPYWQPYCNGGRWIYTDYGWYWLSGYSWGWAPFHYGRWFRHNHYGWCWAPGTTWGPSWVTWRYNGYYCGWAPLPPAAVYQPTVGLTFHGQHVGSSFAFGLGVRSYTFVPVSHFADPHPHRYALSYQNATQVYHQTAPSVTIVGNSTRVVNRGIPVSHVETASHSQIHRIGIREADTPAVQGTRGERLEPNNRILSIFRPQFPQSTGAQAPSGSRPQPNIQRGGAGAAITPMPAPSLTTPTQAPRSSGANSSTQPNRGGGSIKRSDRSALGTSADPIAPTGSAMSVARRPINLSPKPAESLFLHGSDQSQTRWAAPQTVELPARAERPWQYTAPAFYTPATTSRITPAPSYSPPAPPPAPRVEPAPSQPVHFAPPAPAASAPTAHSSPSTGRNWR